MAEEVVPCVDRALFLDKITELKLQTKSKKPEINFYIEHGLYEKAKKILKQKKQERISDDPIVLSSADENTIKRKKWSYANGKRSNRTFKEDLRAILQSEAHKELKRWCESTSQASYTMNITHHRAINERPYEVVFGFKANREHRNVADNEDEMPGAKRQKRIERQEAYNQKMVEQTKRKQKFKKDDIVAIQIERPDKTSCLHPRMLIGKVVSAEESNYCTVVTEHGRIKGTIAPNRLNHCTSSVPPRFDNDRQITFTEACKKCAQIN
ncbi:predicted protein [Nematostella vectensis]|uniref:Uncharacterized protein n=1 Tax=Nematostella vectensis TaxID=45351 RepID=A7S3M7_NEMVE|nr:predicted protein [Nematostella vectensis]|eukprot:XP_001633727.1 predicted protein [Nematostella vectensis]